MEDHLQISPEARDAESAAPEKTLFAEAILQIAESSTFDCAGNAPRPCT
jgi:hypothetical protein